MAEEGQSGAAASSQQPFPHPFAHLTESTLWKEDDFKLGHTSVWGSCYDPAAKRWGYACCNGVQRDQPCPVAPPPNPQAAARAADGSDSGLEVTSPDSEDQTEFDPWDWSNPPAELLPVEKIKQPAAYIEHWIHYFFGAWEREQESGFKSFSDMEKVSFKGAMKGCQDAITPLLWRMKKGVSLDRGEQKDTKRSRETRTSMEGKFVKEKSVLGQLVLMASKAADRDYISAHAAYMHMTFGNKMWNLTYVTHVAACTMKGAREYRRNRDSLNTYDMDPLSQKYMQAMKKLCHFSQCIRPNDDHSKNVVL